MESILARLAVYNVAGFLKYLNSHWFFVVVSLGCIVTAYIYYTNVDRKSERNLNVQNANNIDEEAALFISRFKNWLKLYKMCPAEIYKLWIDPINTILSKNNDSVILRVHSIEVEEGPSISDVKYEFLRSSTPERTCVHFVVRIPMIKVCYETRRAGTSSWDPLSVQLYNFSVAMLSYFHHISTELVKVHVDVVSNPNFNTSDTTDNHMNVPQKLADAMRVSQVYWNSSHSSDLASPEPSVTPDLTNMSVKSHSVTNASQNNGDLLKELDVQPSLNHRGSIQSGPIVRSDPSEFPLRNASSVEYTATDSSSASPGRLTGSKNLDRLLQKRLFRGVLNGTSPTSTERMPEMPASSSNPTIDDSASGTPVVLAYNERIRQSMAARQLPRKSSGQLVRSASYYGENTSKVDSGQDSPAIYEPEAVGDPVPIMCRDDLIEAGSAKDGILPPEEQRLLMQQQHQELHDYKSLTHTCTMESIQAAPESQGFAPITPHSRCTVPHFDSPSTPGHGLSFLASKKLLVKVVKAEELTLKATSNAYCVVELDEPYQRHTTHCSSAGQLFWDQHLLFDLNTNSKRVALEVFELSKRKKSVSKGRAEQLLSSLLCPCSAASDFDQDSLISYPWDSSEPRRRLPLLSVLPGSAVLAPSTAGPTVGSTAATASSSGGGTGVAAPGSLMTHLNPTITAEFHLMEKANEEALAARQRMTVCNQSAVQRAFSTRGNAQSFSAQDSPVLGATLAPNSPLSHSTSLEFGHAKFVLPKHTNVIAEGQVIDELHTTEAVSKGPQPLGSEEAKLVGDTTTGPTVTTPPAPTLRTAQLFSPVPLRRAQLVSCDQPATQTASPTPFRSKPPALELSTDVSGGCGPMTSSEVPKSPLSLDQPVESGEITTPVELGMCGSPSFTKGYAPDRTLQLKNEKSGEGLQRTDSLLKRSNLIGADESSGSAQRMLIPYPDSDFDLSQDDSNNPSGTSTTSRSHSLASRIRTSRLLGSGVLRSGGKRTGDESAVSSSTSSLALLGPTRQLAGVVASMSTLPTDSGTSPSSAAALASAVAVAGATGSWQQPSLTASGERIAASTSRAGTESTSAPARSPTKTRDESHEVDPPMRHVPPAASVAAALPGTYTALAQPRRSDSSNLSLFRLFRHKKKRFRSVGAEKLLYLENNDLEEFDAMSTEGYYRIAQDTDPNNQTPPPRH